MVSRRNFFTITLIMLVLLVLFQAPEVLRERLYDYGSNAYANTTKTEWDRRSDVAISKKEAQKTGRYIVLIGDLTDRAVGSAVRQWCACSKRYVEAYPRLLDCSFDNERMPDVVVIDSDCLRIKKDTPQLETLAKNGVHLIFCGLPDRQQLRQHTQLKKLMGIREIPPDDIRVEGIHLYAGLLLGGEKLYKQDDLWGKTGQDKEFGVPWCRLASGTKTYMAGISDVSAKKEEAAALIWRNSIGEARVFVVNGDYIYGNVGIGFLEGMMYEADSYALYPIINAQNLVVLNDPAPACGNEEEMMRLYSRTPQAVFQDLVWPGLFVTMEKSKKKMTCMLEPQQNHTDHAEPDSHRLVSHMKLLQERFVEAGISKSVTGKYSYDYINKALADYEFLSVYQGAGAGNRQTEQMPYGGTLSNVRTILTDYDHADSLVGYFNQNITKQLITHDGWNEHTFYDDLRLNSMETALGYSCIAVDLNRILYPQSQDDTWEKLYDVFSGNVNTYWKDYESFAATTLAESDLRIRRFLALRDTHERDGDVIHLELENFDSEAFFLLRLHGETVKDVQGAQYERLVQGDWLVQATQDHVTITVGEETTPIFYDNSADRQE